MYLISIILIAIFVVADITMGFYIGSTLVSANFCGLFLCFVVLRRPFRYVVVLVFLYSMVARVFSGYGFTEIFFSLMITLTAFYKIRTEIYTESYLVQAFWVMIFLAFKSVALFLFDWSSWHVHVLVFQMGQIFVNALFNSILAIPVFYFLDTVLDFGTATRSNHSQDDTGMVF